MSVTIVNEWWFRDDGNIDEGKEAAAELVEYFNNECASVQLSLWIEDRVDPLHHFHITVFDNHDSVIKIRESDGIKRFIDKFWPHIIRDETYKSPACDTWLCSVKNMKEVDLIK